ncbi:MAG: hypothetical protein CFH34_01696 [Alphaproteobacteria bacterium MarineAlpha9_Bin4]|nr:hypothetical protein [Pelagibacterales bacterium]PPR24783.1 MAG: hypothetical protein CFH34_01696 [Alphaproteobacteria bacterium MarineAlpha9_Bin4]
MKLIFIFFFFARFASSELLIDCENKYSYKITNLNTKHITPYYSFNGGQWTEIKKFKIKDDTIEFFIPNSKYLACTDDSLPTCHYSTFISGLSNQRLTVSEIVLNDCYIGTMGCNKYKKGLELNQRFCKLN